MVKEVLAFLDIKAGGAYIDCTVGEGGHGMAVLQATTPSPRLLGIDLDAEALQIARRRLESYGERAVLAQGNFADLERLATEHRFRPVDGVLLDVGVSSLQLETAERGFSFSRAGQLDMRFDRSQALSALQVVNEHTERQLADIIATYGEEPRAKRIARAIVEARPVTTTVELANAAGRAGRYGKRGQHPATRTFQALRVFVNGEITNLQAGLEKAIRVLRLGGRLVVISYHSLEDRLVKTFLRNEASSLSSPAETLERIREHTATVRLISRKVVRPTREEVLANPRSRSARLRVAERL
jgi:16S rRNA (cytosine1402-N4)-methyltransferase